ncbi:MAG: hypothetical protein JXB05_24695, partial [Myxococcaceae bacterium]|nr:hypothetical protein [Myxococcaceae bacterium]
MAGALKAGGVYVAVSAAIGDFAKTMGQVVRSVEQTAKRVKESAKAIADVGTLFAAGMGGAVLAAAQSNRAIQADLEKLKGYLYTLAADIGDAFGPFLRELTQAIGSVVGAFQRLSPEVKAGAAQLVAMVASAGAGAAVLSKSAALVEGLAKATGLVLVPALNSASTAAKLLAQASSTAFPAVGKAVAGMEAGVLKSLARMAVGFGAVLLPVLAVAAAVAGLALLAGAVYEAWESAGLKEWVQGLWESVKKLAGELADTLAGWWSTLAGFLKKGAQALLEVLATVVRQLASTLKPLAELAGLEGLSASLGELSNLTGKRLLEDLEDGATFLFDKAAEGAKVLAEGAVSVGKEVGEGVSRGLAYSAKGLKRAYENSGLSKLPGQLKEALSGALGGPAGKVRAPFKEVEVSTVGAAGSGMTDALRSLGQGGMTEIGRLGTKVIGDRLRAARDEAQRLADELYQGIANARKTLVDRFLGSLSSSLTALVDAAQTGFAAGGPEGAVAAVALELLMQSEAFQQLMEIVTATVQQVADALGAFIVPLQDWYAALFMVVDAVMQALVPVLQQLGQVISPLVPLVVLVADLLAALAPVITLLMQVLNPLMIAF